MKKALETGHNTMLIFPSHLRVEMFSTDPVASPDLRGRGWGISLPGWWISLYLFKGLKKKFWYLLGFFPKFPISTP